MFNTFELEKLSKFVHIEQIKTTVKAEELEDLTSYGKTLIELEELTIEFILEAM